MSFWSKRPSGGARQRRPAKLDFSKVAEAEAASAPVETPARAQAKPQEPARPSPNPAPPKAQAPASQPAKPEQDGPAFSIKPKTERKIGQARKRKVKLAPPPKQAKPKKPFSLVIGSGSVVSVAALFLILFAWGAGMTLVLIFGDKLSARLIAQNSEMQDAYEQRLQAYRDEIARVVTEAEQSKVDKDSVTGRVVELTRRQRALETRQAILNRLADQIGADATAGASGSSLTTQPAGASAPPPPPPPRPGFPTRATQPGQTRGSVDLPSSVREAAAESLSDERPLVRLAAAQSSPTQLAQFFEAPSIEASPSQSEAELEAQVDRLERAVSQLDAQQTLALNGFARQSDMRIERFRGAMSTLGLAPEQIAPETGRATSAAPALILPLSEQNTPFGRRINQIRGNVSLLARLQPAIRAMPVDRPTAGFRLASPFGFRIHPIYKTSRLHAGLDMAAPLGTPVRAAGSGVVLSAGWGGGYGNLIQIDHGNGVVSRYAHLSAIEVAQGQPVAVGAQIGLMGSTGASTGSHLHFETRIRSAPQNPACFLIAGDRLRDVTNPGFVCDSPPFHEKMPEKQEDEDDDS